MIDSSHQRDTRRSSWGATWAVRKGLRLTDEIAGVWHAERSHVGHRAPGEAFAKRAGGCRRRHPRLVVGLPEQAAHATARAGGAAAVGPVQTRVVLLQL